MSRIYDALYEFSKSDFSAAQVLAENGFYPQAIYLYAQTFEKATKAVVALYLISYENKSESDTEVELRKTHVHKLIKLTKAMLKIFVDKDRESYILQGGKESDEYIRKPYRSLESLEGQKYAEVKLIQYFRQIVKHNYEKFYMNLKEDQSLTNSDPGWKSLQQKFANPATKYLRYGALAWILSPLLENMDSYTRYPAVTVDNNNLVFLLGHENKESCVRLAEMINDLINLVPLVWKKIESYNTNSVLKPGE
jgi:HEPN domain-containing protein